MHRPAASAAGLRTSAPCVCMRGVFYQIHILVGQMHFHCRALVTPFTHLLLASLRTAQRPWREVTGLSALPKSTPVGHMFNLSISLENG